MFQFVLTYRPQLVFLVRLQTPFTALPNQLKPMENLIKFISCWVRAELHYLKKKIV